MESLLNWWVEVNGQNKLETYNYILTYKNIIDKDRGYLIYEFQVNDDLYSAELNVRPDEINGGTEIELLYKANDGYEQIIAENIWKLYYTISMIYVEGVREFVSSNVDISHFKIRGFSSIMGDDVVDTRKDRIGIKYIKKYCNITDVFEDNKGNIILKAMTNNILK